MALLLRKVLVADGASQLDEAPDGTSASLSFVRIVFCGILASERGLVGAAAEMGRPPFMIRDQNSAVTRLSYCEAPGFVTRSDFTVKRTFYTHSAGTPSTDRASPARTHTRPLRARLLNHLKDVHRVRTCHFSHHPDAVRVDADAR